MVNKIENLVVDTTAFINAAPLHKIATNIVTVQEVVDEITNKRQLKRLVVLPYHLIIKDVFPENIQVVTEFSKKTGDYPSLSATDIKVMALSYQLEKEKVGIEHIRTEPIVRRSVTVTTNVKKDKPVPLNISGFYLPKSTETTQNIHINTENLKEEYKNTEDEVTHENNKVTHDNDEVVEDEEESIEEDTDIIIKTDEQEDLSKKFATLDCGKPEDVIEGQNDDDILKKIDSDTESLENEESGYNDDDDEGWITPNNLQKAKKQMNDKFVEDKPATVACITTDFAMQNVLKQMNLNIAALDGRMIKQIRTFILRCHTCFKTTSLMEKVFCPKCGNKTLKKVSVSIDKNGRQVIHINGIKPLSAKGKKFSLPTFKGGKHSNNPILSEDQPMPQQRLSRQARMKNNPMDPDYIAGYSPFVMRDVNSRSALLGIRPGCEVKHWMKKNPNEPRRKRK